jgi:DNA anti-recombination protein RmuC
MRSTALAFKDEFDEAPVSSQEILERDVGAIRADLNELKTDFRAVVKRIDERIDAAVSKLEGEIRAMASKAAEDIKQLSQDMREMRGEDKALRDKMERGHETLHADIDKVHDSLDTKIDKSHNELNAKIDKVHDSLDAKIDKSHNELNAKIDKVHESLDAKIDRVHESLDTKIDKNTTQISELSKSLHSVSTRVNLLLWFAGILGTLILGGISVGTALHWF